LIINYKGGAANVESSASRVDLTPGTTAGGIWNGFRVVSSAPTAGTTLRLYKGELPAFSQNTAVTTNISGFNIAPSGAIAQTALAGTINWDGVSITVPTITQATGAVSADGISVTIPSSAITTGGLINGLNVPAITTGVGAGALNGINIGAITTAGAGTETGILIGNGWDRAIDIGTGLIRSNSLNGITVGACTASQYLGAARVSGGVMTAGTCTNDATGISDIRLKTNLNELGSVLDAIKNINTYSFNYKCNDPAYVDLNLSCDLQTGVVAQELQEIFPDLVNLRDDGYYEVNYRFLGVYTLQAVAELASKIDSQGNATLKVLTADSLRVKGDLTVDGSITYDSLNTPNGNFSSSVVTPRLTASGALEITSGTIGDVSVDAGSESSVVKIGNSKAAAVEIGRAGAATSIKGALVADGTTELKGNVTMSFGAPDAGFRINNNGTPTAVASAIEITDSSGKGYDKLISTTNFTVAGSGDIITNGSLVSKGGKFQLLDAAGQQLISFDQSGSASFTGNLNLASAALTGGLTIGGDLDVAGLSTFQKLATFLGKTIFRQDVEFEGHINVAKDTAGYASFRSGESLVHVDFTNPYDRVPVVNASPNKGQFISYTIDEITKTGFDIKLAEPAANDTTFSWTAFGVADPKTATNPIAANSP
jgi:hypothetical protein